MWQPMVSAKHAQDQQIELAFKYGRCLGAIEVALTILKYPAYPEQAREYLEKFLTEIRSDTNV